MTSYDASQNAAHTAGRLQHAELVTEEDAVTSLNDRAAVIATWRSKGGVKRKVVEASVQRSVGHPAPGPERRRPVGACGGRRRGGGALQRVMINALVSDFDCPDVHTGAKRKRSSSIRVLRIPSFGRRARGRVRVRTGAYLLS